MGSHRVAISAHRGGAERAAAGTLAAYRDSLAAGADYVEFDVQRTLDGHLIAYHDKYAEVRGIYPRHTSLADLRAEVGEVLLAGDLLAEIAGTGTATSAHIDVKEPGFEADIVALAIERLGPDAFVVTGSDDVILAVKRHFPTARTALSLGRGHHEIPLSGLARTRWTELHPLRRVRACGAEAVAVHHRLARLGVLATCARHGIGTMVWTVNDPARIQSCLADDRIDVLITERPRFAMHARQAQE